MLIGAQFNQNLFAPQLVNARGEKIPGTQVPEESLGDLQQRLTVLKPQFVRVFFSPHQDKGPPSTRESFIKTVQLAQAVRATINITVQSVLDCVADPETGMKEFAAVLGELVHSYGITNARWVTLQNEPNTPGSTHINPPVLNRMYRELEWRVSHGHRLRPFAPPIVPLGEGKRAARVEFVEKLKVLGDAPTLGRFGPSRRRSPTPLGGRTGWTDFASTKVEPGTASPQAQNPLSVPGLVD